MVEELRSMKPKEAAKKVEDGIEETITYCDFPSERWARIRTNSVIERLDREIRRRTLAGGLFPRRQLCPHAGLCQAVPCGRFPVGEQEVHECEALGDHSGKRLCCRLISFSRAFKLKVRKALDITVSDSSSQR